jgi:hypothetical protein
MKPLLLAATLLFGSTGHTPQNQCSREVLHIRGTPVAVTLCIASAPALSGSVVSMSLAATYSASGSSFTQTSSVRFITGEGPARTLDSVDLRRLGVEGTLHLTLLYDKNLVTIEHAILTPGAVAVK